MGWSEGVIKWSKIAWRDNPRKLYEVAKAKLRRRINEGKLLDLYDQDREVEGYVLMSYLVEPFLLREGSWRFFTHQNRQQALEIVAVFNELGYAVDLFQYDDESVEPEDFSKYNILFGMGPNYDQFAERVPAEARRIFYATTMHWSHLNAAEAERVDRFNRRMGANVSPSRQVPERDFDSIADAIIVVGDEYALETYQENATLEDVYRIRLSSWDFLENTAETKSFEEARRRFLWFGGGGLVLKGLDMLIEIFSESSDLELYICGPVANNIEFTDRYREELRCENIHLVGYTRVGSETFNDVTRKFEFVIHPSGSESISGGVVTCMHRGLIPIVTKGVIRDTNDWGISIQNDDREGIRNAILTAAEMDPIACRRMANRAHAYAKTNFTIETFGKDFEEALTAILKGDSGSQS